MSDTNSLFRPESPSCHEAQKGGDFRFEIKNKGEIDNGEESKQYRTTAAEQDRTKADRSPSECLSKGASA